MISKADFVTLHLAQAIKTSDSTICFKVLTSLIYAVSKGRLSRRKVHPFIRKPSAPSADGCLRKIYGMCCVMVQWSADFQFQFWNCTPSKLSVQVAVAVHLEKGKTPTMRGHSKKIINSGTIPNSLAILLCLSKVLLLGKNSSTHCFKNHLLVVMSGQQGKRRKPWAGDLVLTSPGTVVFSTRPNICQS